MRIKSSLLLAAITVSAAARLSGQQQEWRRLLEASEGEQVAWITSYLDTGMSRPDGDVLSVLTRSKSGLTLPLIEQKIEGVLRSPSSPDNFTDRSVDPERFIALAAAAIAEAGNAQSLKELSKLSKIDEKRFGYLVDHTLVTARGYGNAFTVAYQGFGIGDPAIDSRIVAWAEKELLLLPPPPRRRITAVCPVASGFAKMTFTLGKA